MALMERGATTGADSKARQRDNTQDVTHTVATKDCYQPELIFVSPQITILCMITSIPTTSRVVTLNGAPLSDLASAPVRVHEKYVEPGTAESSTAATTPVSEACRSGSPLAEGSVSESGQCTTHSAVTAKEADADETCAGRYTQVFMPRSYATVHHLRGFTMSTAKSYWCVVR